MSKVTLPSPLANQFKNQHGSLELCDDTGRVIGYFLPLAEHERIVNLEAERRRLYAWAQSQFTDEELDRAEIQEEEWTTEEVLRHVGIP